MPREYTGTTRGGKVLVQAAATGDMVRRSPTLSDSLKRASSGLEFDAQKPVKMKFL